MAFYAYNIKNAKVFFTNFSGTDRFNKNGVMPNFAVFIPEEEVGYYRDDLGLDVKERNNDRGTFYYLKIKVGRYADIYIRDANGAISKVSSAPEDRELDALDNMRFATLDFSFTIKDWDAAGRTGRCCYLKEFFATEFPHSDLYREWMAPDTTLDD